MKMSDGSGKVDIFVETISVENTHFLQDELTKLPTLRGIFQIIAGKPPQTSTVIPQDELLKKARFLASQLMQEQRPEVFDVIFRNNLLDYLFDVLDLKPPLNETRALYFKLIVSRLLKANKLQVLAYLRRDANFQLTPLPPPKKVPILQTHPSPPLCLFPTVPQSSLSLPSFQNHSQNYNSVHAFAPPRKSPSASRLLEHLDNNNVVELLLELLANENEFLLKHYVPSIGQTLNLSLDEQCSWSTVILEIVPLLLRKLVNKPKLEGRQAEIYDKSKENIWRILTELIRFPSNHYLYSVLTHFEEIMQVIVGFNAKPEQDFDKTSFLLGMQFLAVFIKTIDDKYDACHTKEGTRYTFDDSDSTEEPSDSEYSSGSDTDSVTDDNTTDKDIEENESNCEEPQPEQNAETVSEFLLHAFILRFAKFIPVFHNILRNPPIASFTTVCLNFWKQQGTKLGYVTQPFGFVRLEVLNFFALLLNTHQISSDALFFHCYNNIANGSHENDHPKSTHNKNTFVPMDYRTFPVTNPLIDKIIEENIFETFVDCFFAWNSNNIMHHVIVERVFIPILRKEGLSLLPNEQANGNLESGTVTRRVTNRLIVYLLSNCNLLHRLLDSYQLINELKPLNGVNGHLTVLGNSLYHQAQLNINLRDLPNFDEAKWNQFVLKCQAMNTLQASALPQQVSSTPTRPLAYS